MAKIFISYRRKDDPYAARGIADALDKQFGSENVYFDLDALLAGLDWREQIDNMIGQCDVMLVVIGCNWLQVDDSGQSRLEHEDDLVRVEVSSALKRKIPVIPVLVGNADLPGEDALPEDIKPLHRRQYVQVRATSDFNAHIENLIRGIKSVIPESADPTPRWKSGKWKAAIVPVTLGLALIVAVTYFEPWRWGDSATDEKESVAVDKTGAELRVKDLGEGVRVKDLGEGLRVKDQPGLAETIAYVDGHVFKDCEEACPEMVVIPAGRFVMGGQEADELPRHEVRVPRFALSIYEITRRQYAAFALDKGIKMPYPAAGRFDTSPVTVSWFDASDYVKWLSETTGERYRLPNEAEWEYAARAGTDTEYWWGDDFLADGKSRADCYGEGCKYSGQDPFTHREVGRKDANPFGLHDMNGNVSEWVEDCWHDNYENAPSEARAWGAEDGGICPARTHRGGSYRSGAYDLRSANRVKGSQLSLLRTVGFRVAREIPD